MNINDEYFSVGDACDAHHNCRYDKFREFMISREFKGDWDAACNGDLPPEDESSSKWWIALIVVGGLLLLGALAYFIVTKCCRSEKPRHTMINDQTE